MKSLRLSARTRNLLLAWLGLVAFFTVLTCLFPRTGDDWHALNDIRAAGKDALLYRSLLVYLKNSVTGRVLTGMWGHFFLTERWLSVVYRVALFTGLLAGMWRLSGLPRYGLMGLAIAFLLSFAAPRELFRQCYSWYCGLVNYLPPVVFLFAYLALILPLFSGKPVRDTWWKAALALLTGFTVQLFLETVTVYCLAMSVAVVVWHRVSARKLSWTTVAFCLGAALGGALMFTRAEYRYLAATGEAMHTIPKSLGMALYVFKLNYAAFTHYLYKDYALLHWLVSGCSLYFLYGNGARGLARGKAAVRTAVSVLLVAMPLYFALMAGGFDEATGACRGFSTLAETFGGEYPAILLDALLGGLYCVSVLYVLLTAVSDARIRNFGIFCMASAVLVSAPMCILEPVEYRCFFLTYLFWALLSLRMIVGVLDAQKRPEAVVKRLAPICCALAVGLCAYYLLVFARCPEIDRQRAAYTEARMAEGATSIVLPQYACADYLHLPDDALEFYYYYPDGRGIEFTFVPYDQWLHTGH